MRSVHGKAENRRHLRFDKTFGSFNTNTHAKQSCKYLFEMRQWQIVGNENRQCVRTFPIDCNIEELFIRMCT